MLQEIAEVNQDPNEPFRRWFTGSNFDLIVWIDPLGNTIGFQLCYHDGDGEKALTWMKDKGFSHRAVDDGEERGYRPKRTPILVPDGVFHMDHVLDLFQAASRDMDPAVAKLVIETLKTYPRERSPKT